VRCRGAAPRVQRAGPRPAAGGRASGEGNRGGRRRREKEDDVRAPGVGEKRESRKGWALVGRLATREREEKKRGESAWAGDREKLGRAWPT
jgi:hypothetical protein